MNFNACNYLRLRGLNQNLRNIASRNEDENNVKPNEEENGQERNGQGVDGSTTEPQKKLQSFSSGAFYYDADSYKTFVKCKENLNNFKSLECIKESTKENANAETKSAVLEKEKETYMFNTLSDGGDLVEAMSNLDPQANSYSILICLKEYGFSDEEISQYFEEKPMAVTGDNGIIKTSRAYFIKDGITINNSSVTTIKDLMIALGKTEFFDQLIEKVTEHYSEGDSEVKQELKIRAQKFFNDWNGDIEQFGPELGQYLKKEVREIFIHKKIDAIVSDKNERKTQSTSEATQENTTAETKSDGQEITTKEFDKGKINPKEILENYKKSHMKKEEILGMGFTEDEFKKYFRYNGAYIQNEKGEFVETTDEYTFNEGVKINGRTINSLEDLKYELFEEPIEVLKRKLSAGVINKDEIIAELQKLGATDVSIKPHSSIENLSVVTYTYRGKTDYFYPEYFPIEQEPSPTYDDNGEQFVIVEEPWSRQGIMRSGFTDNDLNEYFEIIDNNNESVKLRGKYKLKSGIVIDGHKINSVRELYYFVVLARLK